MRSIPAASSSYDREGILTTGIVDLRPLIQFAKEIPLNNAFEKHGKHGREYGIRIAPIVESVPEAQGFYIWGRYDQGRWCSIYIGKSTRGKIASLRYRLSDELREERAFAWVCPHSETEIRNAYVRIWGSSLRSMNHLERSLAKQGSEFITWVACPSLPHEFVRPVEAALIAHSPEARNKQRPKVPDGIDAYVLPILNKFNEVVSNITSVGKERRVL